MKKDKKLSEMSDIIYDTLMKNKQYPQFNPDKVKHQFIENDIGLMYFQYGKDKYIINIERIK